MAACLERGYLQRIAEVARPETEGGGVTVEGGDDAEAAS